VGTKEKDFLTKTGDP